MFSFLFTLLTHYFMLRHNAEVRLLKAQIKILRDRAVTKRIIPSAELSDQWGPLLSYLVENQLLTRRNLEGIC